MLTDLQTLSWLGPELVLVATATLLVVGGAFLQRPPMWLAVAVLGYLAAGGLLCTTEVQLWLAEDAPVLSGPLASDALGFLLRHLALAMGIILSLSLSRQRRHRLYTEMLGLLMLLTAGGLLAARANELVFLFVSLELVSIPTYVLLYLGRQDRAGGEATAKYFYLSVLSSALLLYGLSFLYGAAGTTWLTAPEGMASLRGAVLADHGSMAAFGLILVMAGLGFKIAAAPFHFYAPDVYQGTSNGNAAILAVAPKIAGFAALLRLLVVGLAGLHELAWQLTLVLAALTMTIGNVCALWQTNIRRLMAYSSIAHAGYMLIGIAVATATGEGGAFGGVAATLFYLVVYSLAVAGFFAVLCALETERQPIQSLDQLAGLGASQPLYAAAIAVFMFSLAGIPPLAGFWGKLTLFTSAVGLALRGEARELQPWFLGLAIVGVLNAAVAAAYYLRVIAAIYFRSTTARRPEREPAPIPARLAVVACAVLVVVLGLRAGPLATWSSRADHSLFTPSRTAPTSDRASLPRAERKLAKRTAARELPPTRSWHLPAR